ncbi:MAG: hypothetical protein VKN15_03550 [Cyanobacteriota bacterium]|nr:hypothetical protein [Cyanobacteriota bacterium]
MLGLGLCGLAWAIALAPSRQPLEGALSVRALGFTLQPPSEGAGGPAQGLLAVSLRSLSIKGLGTGEPSLLPFSGQRLPLNGGRELSMIASSAEPLELRIALSPGTRVENLQLDGRDELVLDLLPPRAGSSAEQAVAELTIIPPEGPAVANSQPLQALFQEPGRPERRLSSPDTQFRLPLTDATRLRLQRALPERPVVFERNLPVREVLFTTERQSLFDQTPITFSTLRSGTLHLGRMKPLSLRADQFLQIQPPGITVLTSLRSEQSQLAVEVVGATDQIRSGFSQKHPTTVVSGTLLSRQLSPDEIKGFFGFLVGAISSLVLTFFKGD